MSAHRILLMVGDEALRLRLAETLESSGWLVTQTTNAAVGIDTAKCRSPELILLDVATPSLEAEKLALLFKSDAITCKIPIIAVSDVERSPGLRESWAIDSISRTTSYPTLLARLKNALRQRVRKPYVLIVDDEPDLVDLMQTALTQKGYIASGASNGMEALEIMRSVQPDAILLDLDMPLLNGWDFLHQIRAGPGLGTTKVIILTGADQSLEDRQHGLQLGACNYLLKPCEPDEVIRAVEAALAPPSNANTE